MRALSVCFFLAGTLALLLAPSSVPQPAKDKDPGAGAEEPGPLPPEAEKGVNKPVQLALTGQAGGLNNGFYLLKNVSVLDDAGAADTLTGGAGIDLFFIFDNDRITDLEATEHAQ